MANDLIRTLRADPLASAPGPLTQGTARGAQ